MKPGALAALAAAGWMVLAPAAGFARSEPKHGKIEGEPVRAVLWAGNSFFYFNNGIHRYFNGIAAAVDKASPVRNTIVTISGAGIDWHDLDSYLRPDSRIGSYSFLPNNTIRANKPGRQYDTVVIMDCSQCPIHPELKAVTADYAKRHSATARKYGIRPVFFMSWAYKDEPAMTQQLADAYIAIANENDAHVIPAGLAFARAVKERPDVELYDPDKRHPSLVGTYLAAATSYAALTGKNPEGNKTYHGGLDPQMAAWLHGVAWNTVQEFQASARAKAR